MPRPANLIPLTKKHYTAIGRVAMEWTALEGFIAYAVRVLLGGSDSIGRVVTANTSFLSHCDMLTALLHMRLVYKPNEVKKVCKMIRALNEDHPNHKTESKRKSPRTRRNEIIHGSWIEAAIPAQIFTVTYKARGKLRHHVTVQTPEKIDAFATEIAELMNELYDELMPLLETFQAALKAASRNR